jgi:hypothetical protein
MQVDAAYYWTPKSGNSAAEYEDAFSPRSLRSGELDGLRIAVADGATEGFLSKQWADVLVRAFRDARNVSHSELLDCARSRWPTVLARYRDQRRRSGRPLMWYEENGLQEGAYATFIGAFVSERTRYGATRRTWRALAVGDCCVFHTRRSKLLESFPITASSAFTTHPDLLATDPRRGPARSALKSASGAWRPADTFYLASDAVAAWCLRENEKEQPIWDRLAKLDNRQFMRLVADLRDAQEMRNDDVTLVRLTVH